MHDYDFKPLEAKLAAAQEWLSKEYRGLRTGRAAPALLDGIMVSAYGSMMPLKQYSNVAVEDARTLRVSAYDASILIGGGRAGAAAGRGGGAAAGGAAGRGA